MAYGHVQTSDGLSDMRQFQLQRFTRCCTALTLGLDDQQNDRAETLQPRDIDWQPCENVEERTEMQRSEKISWQTAKESKSNTGEQAGFELPSDTRQQREDDSTQNKLLNEILLY